MSKRVVIADDSATARMFARRCLEIAGLAEADFVEVSDGEQALEELRRQPADLLVTDLTMPHMDGVELLRRIAASPKLSGLPVMVVSSASGTARDQELVRMGAAAILPKPITPEVMYAELQKMGIVAGGADE